MGSNLGHGAFIAPTKEYMVLSWGSVRTLELTGFNIQAQALSRILQAYERISNLVTRSET